MVQEKKMVQESSGISQLHPFLDNRSVLLIGTRLIKSNLTEEENHSPKEMCSF